MALVLGAPGFFEPRFPPPIASAVGHAVRRSASTTRSPLRSTLEIARRFRPHQQRRRAPQRRRGQSFAPATSPISTARSRRSGPSISWRAARCRRAFRPSRSTASAIGTAAWCRTRRCNMCSTTCRAATCWCSRSICSARPGRCRKNLLEVAEREKDIRYSSRTRLNTDYFKYMQNLRRAVHRVVERLPDRVPERSGCGAICGRRRAMRR